MDSDELAFSKMREKIAPGGRGAAAEFNKYRTSIISARKDGLSYATIQKILEGLGIKTSVNTVALYCREELGMGDSRKKKRGRSAGSATRTDPQKAAINESKSAKDSTSSAPFTADNAHKFRIHKREDL